MHVSLQFTHSAIYCCYYTISRKKNFKKRAAAKTFTPMGFPLGAAQVLPESVVDHSLKASCPFKSFISITQQVQWHTSNKQPEKENWQGWVEPARRRNQTPTDRQALWSEPSLWLQCKHTRIHSRTHKQLWQKKKKNGLAWPIWRLIRTCKSRGDFVLPLTVKIKVNCIWCFEAGARPPWFDFNQFQDKLYLWELSL